MHPKYKKYIRVWKKVKAHDQNNTCQEGDLVQIMETRPLSRQKNWRVLKIVKKAQGQ
jgi:small subunit ribosomal protein S17